MSLREARQAANDALLLIQRGEKPFILPAPKNVFSKVGQEFLEDKKRRVKPGYYRTMVLRFNRYLYPALGNKDIKIITKDDVRDLLLEIAATRNETARRLLGLLSEVFHFAALRGYVEFD